MAAHLALRLALVAFAIAEVRGAIQGGEFTATTKTGLWAAVLFFFIGLLVGELTKRVVEESARREFDDWTNANFHNSPTAVAENN